MTAYVFPAIHAHKAELELEPCNRTCASPIYSGPHAGKMFLDAGLAEREPRWIPLFQPLIADTANEVDLVELELADIQPAEGNL